MSQPRRPDGSVLPDVAICDAHCCHPVKPASINGDAKVPNGVEIHQQWGNVNGRVTTKEEDEYYRFKFNSAEGDDLYLVFCRGHCPGLDRKSSSFVCDVVGLVVASCPAATASLL